MEINKITITMETANSAFDDNVKEEIARILEVYAQKLRDDMSPAVLRDINGNKVGTVEYE